MWLAASLAKKTRAFRAANGAPALIAQVKQGCGDVTRDSDDIAVVTAAASSMAAGAPTLILNDECLMLEILYSATLGIPCGKCGAVASPDLRLFFPPLPLRESYHVKQ